jgi:hypothetical protein
MTYDKAAQEEYDHQLPLFPEEEEEESCDRRWKLLGYDGDGGAYYKCKICGMEVCA